MLDQETAYGLDWEVDTWSVEGDNEIEIFASTMDYVWLTQQDLENMLEELKKAKESM